MKRSEKEKALPRLLRYRALGQVNTMTSTVPTALFRSNLESIELPCTEPQDAARRRSNLSQKAIAFDEDGFPVPIEKHLQRQGPLVPPISYNDLHFHKSAGNPPRC